MTYHLLNNMANDRCKREIDYYANLEILKKLEKMFIESNKRLAKNYNINLPDSYFSMKF